MSLLAGLVSGLDTAPGRLTLGAFIEYGNGSYDTYNSFSSAAAIHGDGDIYYMGGGLLGRLDFNPTGPGHFYGETSLRAGGVHNQYASSDLRTGSGLPAAYDSSSAYYSLHLGGGYEWDFAEFASLNIYGKYFWTRQEGDEVTLSSGELVSFAAMDSSRVRLGGRLTYNGSAMFKPYAGAAWEYELAGEADASTNGFSIDAPSLRGASAVGELGMVFKPSAGLPLSLDLGLQGYAGKREGVSGSLLVKLEF
jgi:outer membrane autotransporter protein